MDTIATKQAPPPRRWFVSRHPGAIAWARARQLPVDCWVEHLRAEQVGPGDQVMGTLPTPVAAAICARGAAYWHLALDLPQAWRGRELGAEELAACNARLLRFEVSLTDERLP